MTAHQKSLKLWYWEGKLAAVIFALGLLAWPFLCFGAIFVFDSPIRSRVDELQRYAFLYLTLAYPVLYAFGWFIYRHLRKKGFDRQISMTAWVFPSVLPAYYLYFLV